MNKIIIQRYIMQKVKKSGINRSNKDIILGTYLNCILPFKISDEMRSAGI